MIDCAATTIGTAQIAVFRHYYGGGSREPVQNRFMDSISPITGKVHGIIARGCSEDVNRAVKAAASAAREGWGLLSPAKRRDFLLKMAKTMEGKRDQLYQVDAVETGMTKSSCKREWDEAIRAWRFYAELALEAGTHGSPPAVEGASSHRTPLGVVAIILPAMSPTVDASRYVAAALACGNTVVVKPSEFATRSALALADLATMSGFPGGAFNVVCGTGEDTGNVLARHSMINHVCFVGSTEAGRMVAANTTRNLSGITCELSAKNSVVIFKDADPHAAADAAVELAMLGNGQSNFCAQRILVHKSLKNTVTKRILFQVTKLVTGNPLRTTTDLGPLICEQNRDRVDCFVRMAVNDGAKILTGGEMLHGGEYGHGFFYSPTVLDNVTADMNVAAEEVRGPVIALMEFDEENRALEICNACRYGMASWLFTADVARAESFGEKLRTGHVLINHGPVSRATLPISPCKESGFGSNLGYDAIAALTRIKTIHRD